MSTVSVSYHLIDAVNKQYHTIQKEEIHMYAITISNSDQGYVLFCTLEIALLR